MRSFFEHFVVQPLMLGASAAALVGAGVMIATLSLPTELGWFAIRTMFATTWAVGVVNAAICANPEDGR